MPNKPFDIGKYVSLDEDRRSCIASAGQMRIDGGKMDKFATYSTPAAWSWAITTPARPSCGPT
jgi:hypothetical protein